MRHGDPAGHRPVPVLTVHTAGTAAAHPVRRMAGRVLGDGRGGARPLSVGVSPRLLPRRPRPERGVRAAAPRRNTALGRPPEATSSRCGSYARRRTAGTTPSSSPATSTRPSPSCCCSRSPAPSPPPFSTISSAREHRRKADPLSPTGITRRHTLTAAVGVTTATSLASTGLLAAPAIAAPQPLKNDELKEALRRVEARRRRLLTDRPSANQWEMEKVADMRR